MPSIQKSEIKKVEHEFGILCTVYTIWFTHCLQLSVEIIRNGCLFFIFMNTTEYDCQFDTHTNILCKRIQNSILRHHILANRKIECFANVKFKNKHTHAFNNFSTKFSFGYFVNVFYKTSKVFQLNHIITDK